MTGAATAPDTAVETALWLAAFAQSRRPAGNGAAWLDGLREAAIARFAATGFPTTADEEWRKTSVGPIARGRFSLASGPVPAAAAEDLQRASFDSRGFALVVFLNGRHAPDLSSHRALPPGVVLCSLDEALRRHRTLVEPSLARQAGEHGRAFASLNVAFTHDGVFLHIPPGTRLADPIHLLYVSTPAGAHGSPQMAHPRNLIVAGRGSRARVVESYVAPQDGRRDVYFTNAFTEILLGPDSAVDHCRLQRESASAFHVGTLDVRQERASRFTSHSISLGGALVRIDINVALADEGAECTLNGLYMTTGRQHVDHHTTIDHQKPRCVSRELYKGVLDGQSRGVFNGKIIVRPDARGTDSVQSNRNLLLSEEALVDTKPELQIHNNDVKCRHAAAIGQLDENALFYLRSRAIAAEAARSILVHAFVSDIVARIPVDPLRETLERQLLSRLGGQATGRDLAP